MAYVLFPFDRFFHSTFQHPSARAPIVLLLWFPRLQVLSLLLRRFPTSKRKQKRSGLPRSVRHSSRVLLRSSEKRSSFAKIVDIWWTTLATKDRTLFVYGRRHGTERRHKIMHWLWRHNSALMPEQPVHYLMNLIGPECPRIPRNSRIVRCGWNKTTGEVASESVYRQMNCSSHRRGSSSRLLKRSQGKGTKQSILCVEKVACPYAFCVRFNRARKARLGSPNTLLHSKTLGLRAFSNCMQPVSQHTCYLCWKLSKKVGLSLTYIEVRVSESKMKGCLQKSN